MTLSLDKSIFLEEISKTSSLDELEKLRIHYIGKKGLISFEMKSLSSLSIEEKKIRGQDLNTFKSLFEKELQNKKNYLENKIINEKLEKERIDITLPPRDFDSGKIHPISQTIYNYLYFFNFV